MIQTVNNVPWPNIRTSVDINNKQPVPLHEDYAFEDMAYLDTIEAYPMFEIQADIIIQKQCKGIVDVGCRHGPVVEILHKKGYTNFKYMGFDTSSEPIAIAQDLWSNYSNIEFRHGSWDNADILAVDFNVDQVIWSGVLLYRPDDHFKFFNKITRNLYNSPNAIIQEPMPTQRHWRDDLVLNRISDDMDEYKESCQIFKEHILDLNVFAGQRLVVDVTL